MQSCILIRLFRHMRRYQSNWIIMTSPGCHCKWLLVSQRKDTMAIFFVLFGRWIIPRPSRPMWTYQVCFLLVQIVPVQKELGFGTKIWNIWNITLIHCSVWIHLADSFLDFYILWSRFLGSSTWLMIDLKIGWPWVPQTSLNSNHVVPYSMAHVWGYTPFSERPICS